jgi:glycosyltransferase involved in cell wall biosynthesis
MTIGYYLSGTKVSDGGIYQYSIYVLKMLLNCDDVTKIYFFHSQEQKKEFEQFLLHPKITPVLYDKRGSFYNFQKKAANFYLTRYYITQKSKKWLYALHNFLDPDRRALNKFKLDVLHVPRQHSPAYNLTYPVVISMHDVQQYHFPEFFTPLERIYKSISYYVSMSETNHAIVSYTHVKNDLNKYFPNISAGVSVCPVPVNIEWLSGPSWTSSAELQKKYKITEQIILTPAATWEHKNHKAVLEAMSLLKSEGMKVFWVSTGNKTKYYSILEKRVKELGLEDQVVFTGIVPEADLRGFYDMAMLMVIPTLYEAGSGPLFESMRYQTPVICSNVTSLPETINNDEFVFDPNNYRQLADLIQTAFTNPGFIARNRANSAERILYYDNRSYAPAFMEAYKKAADHYKQFNLLSK